MGIKGEEVVPCIYKGIHGLVRGVIIAEKENGKYGAINKRNKIVIPFNYSQKEVERMLFWM